MTHYQLALLAIQNHCRHQNRIQRSTGHPRRQPVLPMAQSRL